MKKATLHYVPISPPCRAVQILCNVMGIDLELVNCDLLKGENQTPEFKKINPHKTVPAFIDTDGFMLSESRAILAYLVNKYAPGHSLYPSDPKKRALVDNALYFDGTTIFLFFGMIMYPIIRLGAKFNPDIAKNLEEKLTILDEDLSKTPYVAGDELTIADISLLATFSSIESTGLWDTSKFTNIQNWMKRIKNSGKIKNYDELVVTPANHFGGFVKEKLSKIDE